MTPSQANLLQELIKLDREYRTKVANGDPDACNDDRGVEVGWSCDVRTARVLEGLGLAEIVNIRPAQDYIFLGKYAPLD